MRDQDVVFNIRKKIHTNQKLNEKIRSDAIVNSFTKQVSFCCSATLFVLRLPLRLELTFCHSAKFSDFDLCDLTIIIKFFVNDTTHLTKGIIC